MINEIIVQGSSDTSFHNFSITQSVMDISISQGSYHQNGVEQVSNTDDISITFDTPTQDTDYEIWLCTDKIAILHKVVGDEFGELTNQIDKLAWFTIPSGTTDLDSVEINVIRMVQIQ